LTALAKATMRAESFCSTAALTTTMLPLLLAQTPRATLTRPSLASYQASTTMQFWLPQLSWLLPCVVAMATLLHHLCESSATSAAWSYTVRARPGLTQQRPAMQDLYRC
ncbi:hypothetical protein GGF38_001245, partial [Coemansia sp. RSA 25]